MSTLLSVTRILADTLQLPPSVQLHADSSLLGSLPELDSLAVVHVIAALEEQFEIAIDDEEISAQTFSTVGSLCALVDRKLTE